MTRLQCVTWCMVMILTPLSVRYWSEQFASDSRTVLPSSLLTTQHLGRSAFWLSRHRFHSVDSANLQHHQHPSATLVMLAYSQSRHQMKTFQRQVREARVRSLHRQRIDEVDQRGGVLSDSEAERTSTIRGTGVMVISSRRSREPGRALSRST